VIEAAGRRFRLPPDCLHASLSNGAGTRAILKLSPRRFDKLGNLLGRIVVYSRMFSRRYSRVSIAAIVWRTDEARFLFRAFARTRWFLNRVDRLWSTASDAH